MLLNPQGEQGPAPRGGLCSGKNYSRAESGGESLWAENPGPAGPLRSAPGSSALCSWEREESRLEGPFLAGNNRVGIRVSKSSR